jgi:hypothetical protein
MARSVTSPTYSNAQCIGPLVVSGLASSYEIVRNKGSPNGNYAPVAAPSRAFNSSLDVMLLPRSGSSYGRIGGRAYAAQKCVEGRYNETRYAAIPLLGRTISLTVDISASKCGELRPRARGHHYKGVTPDGARAAPRAQGATAPGTSRARRSTRRTAATVEATTTVMPTSSVASSAQRST